MSRSYKKTPWATDGRNGRKSWKRIANKTIRKYKNEIKKGKAYKKLYCSYNIHDYKSRWPWEEAKFKFEENVLYNFKSYKTLKEFYSYWHKYYRRK